MQAWAVTRQLASRLRLDPAAAIISIAHSPRSYQRGPALSRLFVRQRSDTGTVFTWRYDENANMKGDSTFQEQQPEGMVEKVAAFASDGEVINEEPAGSVRHDDAPLVDWKEEVLHRIKTFQGPPENPGRQREHYFRQLYHRDRPIDFRVLARASPEIANQMLGRRFDTQDTEKGPILVSALLDKHYGGLKMELPPDRLCPPIPNRHLYILWLKDLLDSTGPLVAETSLATTERELVGMDIGTGASAIYPILGCAQRPWKFIATELDEKSFEWARSNLERNGLLDRVNLVRRTKSFNEDSSPLIPMDELGLDRLDFVMTNPPFYESEKDMFQRVAEKKEDPLSAHTGAPVELWCEGGEVGFVRQMINESMVLRDRVQWYTAMLSSPQSVEKLLVDLNRLGLRNIATTTFIPGKVTRRYALAWSFGDRRPSERAARGDKYTIDNKISRSLFSPATEHTIPLGPDTDPEVLGSSIEKYLRSVGLPVFEWNSAKLKGYGFTDEPSWSRSYRRRLQLAAERSCTDDLQPRAGEEADAERSVMDATTSAFEGKHGNDGMKTERDSVLAQTGPPKTKQEWEEELQAPLPTTLPELERALEELQAPNLSKPTSTMLKINELMQLNDDYMPAEDPSTFGDYGRRYEYQYNAILAKQMAMRQQRAKDIEARIARLKKLAPPNKVPQDTLIGPAQADRHSLADSPSTTFTSNSPLNSIKRAAAEDQMSLKDRYKCGFTLELEASRIPVIFHDGKYLKRPFVRDSQLKLRWLSGSDPVIYESLVGALNTKFAQRKGTMAGAIARSKQRTMEHNMRTAKKREKAEKRRPKIREPGIATWHERFTRAQHESEFSRTFDVLDGDEQRVVDEEKTQPAEEPVAKRQ
ncbi:uncharacterized protein B0I36DRAFT_319080 [Microdochium trichocladiopsis]|uniref:Uncharacterized protein n=1 Tax=Microdochium trichocladiopsis TaxID=1682393 RepID=A0A9P9BX69_9PEZI|nr:uncharacterized protein B0I36DRAFT_319080 [Microdochium trichocladiopsis]KAH7035791.1 hypothetical protein B0I36DRAFT_319080 [Microdochium trichocladiopsis]